MIFRYVLAAVSLPLLLAAAPASATPIGPTCGTCQGSIYELTYSRSPTSSTLTTQTFRVTLTINPSSYTGGGAFIDDVAPKVSSMVSGATLVSAPGIPGNWTLSAGGINAGGWVGGQVAHVVGSRAARVQTNALNAPQHFRRVLRLDKSHLEVRARGDLWRGLRCWG